VLNKWLAGGLLIFIVAWFGGFLAPYGMNVPDWSAIQGMIQGNINPPGPFTTYTTLVTSGGSIYITTATGTATTAVTTTETASVVLPTTSYTTYIPTSTQQSGAPSLLSITLTRSSINAGDGVGGTITSDRANTPFITYVRRKGVPNAWVPIMSGVTDAAGRYVAGPPYTPYLKPEIPGIYEFKATMLGVDSNIVSLTIIGFKISLFNSAGNSIDTMVKGETLYVELYSNLANADVKVQICISGNWPVASTLPLPPNTLSFDASGRACYQLKPGIGTWTLRGYIPSPLQYTRNNDGSPEVQWLIVTA